MLVVTLASSSNLFGTFLSCGIEIMLIIIIAIVTDIFVKRCKASDML